jgi:hypothetical protein
MTMKTTRSTLFKCIAVTFAALMLTACGSGSGSGSGGGGGSAGSGGLSLNITDAPVLNDDIAEVWVRFTHVIIHSDGGDDTPQPVTDGTNDWIDINLKELTEGKTMLLGEFDLDAGDYSWIRLVIDPEHTVIVERDVVGEPDEVDDSEPDTLYPAARLNCSSCDQSHLKLNRSFTIENTGWINFTIDFDLKKSLTLQLPQSEKPRPHDAYKLRPTLRILDTELASTFIWGYVTDTLPTGGDPSVCRVYTYAGDMATVVPDDYCSDVCTAGLDPGDRPLDIAHVEGPIGGPFDYQTGSLYPGTYTVALFCEAENLDVDEALAYIGEQEVDATLTPPDGLGSEANFDLSDPGDTTPL